jgi:hypothetical protein
MFWHGNQMYRRLSADVRDAGLSAEGGDPRAVTEDELVGLPATVQRYLRAMGVLNRSRDWSFLAHFTGRFRLKGQGSWMPAEVWQYNSAVEVARIFHMRIDFAGMVPMVGRDTYLSGKGTMHGRLLGLVTVARSEGWETDLSELATYLNDAVLLAPSMLLRPTVSFASVDDTSFDVTLADSGQTVTARVSLDAHDRPVNFSTTDRYADLPGGLVRAEWTTPIDGWQTDADRLVFTRGRAVWQLPAGPLEYLEFHMSPGAVRYNLAPGDITRTPPRTRDTKAPAAQVTHPRRRDHPPARDP